MSCRTVEVEVCGPGWSETLSVQVGEGQLLSSALGMAKQGTNELITKHMAGDASQQGSCVVGVGVGGFFFFFFFFFFFALARMLESDCSRPHTLCLSVLVDDDRDGGKDDVTKDYLDTDGDDDDDGDAGDQAPAANQEAKKPKTEQAAPSTAS